jgi:hypothetical protein
LLLCSSVGPGSAAVLTCAAARGGRCLTSRRLGGAPSRVALLGPRGPQQRDAAGQWAPGRATRALVGPGAPTNGGAPGRGDTPGRRAGASGLGSTAASVRPRRAARAAACAGGPLTPPAIVCPWIGVLLSLVAAPAWRVLLGTAVRARAWCGAVPRASLTGISWMVRVVLARERPATCATTAVRRPLRCPASGAWACADRPQSPRTRAPGRVQRGGGAEASRGATVCHKAQPAQLGGAELGPAGRPRSQVLCLLRTRHGCADDRAHDLHGFHGLLLGRLASLRTGRPGSRLVSSVRPRVAVDHAGTRSLRESRQFCGSHGRGGAAKDGALGTALQPALHRPARPAGCYHRAKARTQLFGSGQGGRHSSQ